jgi:diguanylate cyclase (GGDEF)-like protein
LTRVTAHNLRIDVTREFPASSKQLSGEMRAQTVELRREVVLWQRWIRYAAAALASAGALVLLGLGAGATAWVPILLAASFYYVFNVLVAWYLRPSAGNPFPVELPGLILIADIAMIVALVYFSAPPLQYHRVLLLGFLVLQLAVFHFGTTLGVSAGVMSVGAYVLIALVVPPHIAGPRPTVTVVAFNTILFLFVGGVLVLTFGNFRERMDRLREFCRRVEAGDFGGTLEVADKRPDDVTLLGRSFIEMRGRLADLVGTDPLTGCLNRRALEMRLAREWRQARRRGSLIALLAIDLDKFKPINDTHGHAVGDMVLVELARIMKHTARDTDAVARVGGDEFIVLLPDAGWQGAMTFAERLRHSVDNHVFGENAQLRLTISVGIALARGTDDVTAEYLLEEADRSLYRSKEGGRNRISA